MMLSFYPYLVVGVVLLNCFTAILLAFSVLSKTLVEDYKKGLRFTLPPLPNFLIVDTGFYKEVGRDDFRSDLLLCVIFFPIVIWPIIIPVIYILN